MIRTKRLENENSEIADLAILKARPSNHRLSGALSFAYFNQ